MTLLEWWKMAKMFRFKSLGIKFTKNTKSFKDVPQLKFSFENNYLRSFHFILKIMLFSNNLQIAFVNNPNAGNWLLLYSHYSLCGEWATLRGDMRQMDFGALDYSNDQAKVRRRGVVQAAGHPQTLIKIPFHRKAQRGNTPETQSAKYFIYPGRFFFFYFNKHTESQSCLKIKCNLEDEIKTRGN